jgi:signal transduction histidine kinase
MSADQLLQYVTWAVFVTTFVFAVIRAIRQPQRTNLHIAFFFSVPTAIIVIGVAAALGLLSAGPVVNAINTDLILVMIYLLLRLVDDFSATPPWLIHGSGALLLGLAIGSFIYVPPRPALLTTLQLLYVLGLLVYITIAFARASQHAGGVTYRRLLCIAAGCGMLCLIFAVAALSPSFPQHTGWLRMLSNIFSLAASICYYLGFTPPRSLRRAWQEPELRAFLGRAAQLPRLPDTSSIVHELERGAATSVGAPRASIGLWDTTQQQLRFMINGQPLELKGDEDMPASQAFRTQKMLFVPDMDQAYPAQAATSRSYGARAVLAAPITAAERRLGVLTVYSPYTPVFADDDLALVQLLADQAAVVLESRALIDEAARVQAREEMTRLKDDFLSSAAHDLKTPLTTLIMKAQQLDRRAERNPLAPVDRKGLKLMVQEAERLKRLVLELLDAARGEQGYLLGPRRAVDLVALAEQVGGHYQSAHHQYSVQANGPIIGLYDDLRIQQLFENLVENAIKYSPAGGPVTVEMMALDGQAKIKVCDEGIGIPATELEHIFDRFYRAGNADDRRYAGMGLGLFICRSIVEQHNGQISVTSQLGKGTIVHVSLPLTPNSEVAND